MIEAAAAAIPTSTSSSSPGSALAGSRSASAAAAPAPLTARGLIAVCEQVLTSFNAAQMTLDSHLDAALQAQQQQHQQPGQCARRQPVFISSSSACAVDSSVLNADEAAFVREVVYGVLRYYKFLSALLAALFHTSSGSALRGDAAKCRVLAYLAFFRLHELTWPAFRQLVEAQAAQQMEALLSFLFEGAALQQACRQDCLAAYDKEFVDGTLAGLLSWAPDAQELLADLRQRVFFTQRKQANSNASASSSAVQSRPTTLPQPFNLTQPRPKPLPQPEPVPRAPRAKPPPKPHSGPTKEEAGIQAARAANRAAIAARQADPRFGPFKLRVLERPMQGDALRRAAEDALAAELATRPPKARPPPPPPVSEVRLTAAAVLREEAVYKRKQAEEASALQRYEAELHDAAAFERWQSAARLADALAQQQRVEQLRQQMSTAAAGAVAARSALHAAKAAESAAQKEERAAREAAMQRRQQRARAARAELVQDVAAGREKARTAQAAVLLERRQAAEAVRLQAEEDARTVAAAAAAEAVERREVILQLRGLEAAARRAASAGRLKVSDTTATSDTAINEAMSLDELRERLAAAKQREREEEERVRSHIQAQKAAREAALATKAEQLAAIRRLAGAQAAARKAAAAGRRAQSAAAVLTRHEAGVLTLDAKLQDKRAAAAAEAGRVAAEQQRIRFEQMQSSAGAAVVEAARFRQLREGHKRSCERRQADRLVQAQAAAAHASRLAATRQHAQSQARHERDARQRRYDTDHQRALQQAGADSEALTTRCKAAAAAQRQHEKQAAAAAGRGERGSSSSPRREAQAAGEEQLEEQDQLDSSFKPRHKC